jgi:hypothetical protein
MSKKKEQNCQSLIKQMWNFINNTGKKLSNKNLNKLNQCIEKNNIDAISKNDDYDMLYPNIGDPNISNKIANKKEFKNTIYPIRTKKDFKNIVNISQKICNNTEFELSAHQMFIRNFMSFQTPYNSLLLFHGLGTGKTCSSITVCEEMRTYFNQLNIKKKIMIVAQPNVQENYKIQLFDKSKLKNIDGLWNLKSCTGNKFLKEINPMNMKGLSKDKVIHQIEKIIKSSYEFMGHQQFANKIGKIIGKNKLKLTLEEQKKKKIKAIKAEFSNRLLVIDEVHNVRNVENLSTSAFKSTSQNYLDLVKYTNNMKLLLLTATPMFNDHTEIIWLLNLMNLNDNRFEINVNEVFDKEGNFLVKNGQNIGEELLKQKMYGYVSFIQGEDPFNFPLKLYPSISSSKSFIHSNGLRNKIKNLFKYPTHQLNDVKIKKGIQYLDLYVNNISDYQKKVYFTYIEYLKETYTSLRKQKGGIQYTLLGGPLQMLNISYPYNKFDNHKSSFTSYDQIYGDKGLKRIASKDFKKWNYFDYNSDIEEKYGRIFSMKEGGSLKKYSPKIASIIEILQKSEGIIMIYSQFIGGGCIPLALALEEAGYDNYMVNNIFKKKPIKKSEGKYMMITGDVKLSPKNKIKEALTKCNSIENKDGKIIKVIIISKAGSEGIDFKNIRQIHILEPWYNLNRIGQIEGRGVRNLSHCNLSYKNRNVLIFLHALHTNNKAHESADFYVYRHAEKKAIAIGKVSRLIKELSVDCLLNNQGHNSLNADKIGDIKEKITLSTNDQINYPLGHKNYSHICDFMNCEYKCKPKNSISEISDDTTYNQTFLTMNIDKILKKIKDLFKYKFVYDKKNIFSLVRANSSYSSNQIYQALTILIDDETELIEDMFGRYGNLINIDDLYLFQPKNVTTKNLSSFKRKTPILTFKTKKIDVILPTVISSNIEIAYIDELQKKFNDLTVPHIVNSSNQNQYDWVANFYNIYEHLLKPPFSIDKDRLITYGLHHILDTLSFENKKNILNEIDTFEDKQLKTLIKQYFEKQMIEEDKIIGLFNYKKANKINILIKDNGKWVLPKKDTNTTKITQKMLKKWTIDWKLNINKDIIGFMNQKTITREDIIFRTKSNIKGKTKGKGGRSCTKEKKSTMKTKITHLYQKINPGFKTKNLNVINGKIPSSLMYCIMLELLLRNFDKEKIKGDDEIQKRWFFSPFFSELWGVEYLPETEKTSNQKYFIKKIE